MVTVSRYNNGNTNRELLRQSLTPQPVQPQLEGPAAENSHPRPTPPPSASRGRYPPNTPQTSTSVSPNPLAMAQLDMGWYPLATSGPAEHLFPPCQISNVRWSQLLRACRLATSLSDDSPGDYVTPPAHHPTQAREL